MSISCRLLSELCGVPSNFGNDRRSTSVLLTRNNHYIGKVLMPSYGESQYSKTSSLENEEVESLNAPEIPLEATPCRAPFRNVPY